MRSSRNLGSFLKPCSLQVHNGPLYSTGETEQTLLSLSPNEIEKCVSVLLEFSEQAQLQGSTKYLCCKLFANFVLTNPFFPLDKLYHLMLATFSLALKQRQSVEMVDRHPLHILIQHAGITIEEDEIKELQVELLEEAEPILKEDTPYDWLERFVEIENPPIHFQRVLESFLDFCNLSPMFLLTPPNNLLEGCMVASYHNMKTKPGALASYIQNLEKNANELSMAIVEKLSASLGKKQ